MRYLEAQGYVCARSAGSHGPWDVVAVRDDEVLLAQVKAGSAKDDGKLAALAFPRSPHVRRVTFLWPDRAQVPTILEHSAA